MVEVIDVIHRTMTEKWKRDGKVAREIDELWNEYVPRHLLPRLHGFELMMAPYSIAHMKIGLKLRETHYSFLSSERARIYLTNTLEEPKDFSSYFEQMAPALAHEAGAANKIKRSKLITVVIGNPPYSVTSLNSNSFVDGLMNIYKEPVRGEQGLVALSDDYLKFMRYGQHILSESPMRILGFITNRGYLKGIIHRGVRASLLKDFGKIGVVDLHGDTNIGEQPPVGVRNDNVFDIQQGVAISLLHKGGKELSLGVQHADLWGSRSEKFETLLSYTASTLRYELINPTPPEYFLVPFDKANEDEYKSFFSLDELMRINSCGVKTHRDAIITDFDRITLRKRISDLASDEKDEVVRKRYEIKDTPHWSLAKARRQINPSDIASLLQQITYRPFDFRWIYYNPQIIEKGDSKFPTLRHMLRPNIALLTSRIQAAQTFNAVFVSTFLVEMKTAESTRSSTVFPLYLYYEDGKGQRSFNEETRHPNIAADFAKQLGSNLNLTYVENKQGDLQRTFGPADGFHYIYAILYSSTYRDRYSEFLTVDFPRIPLTSDAELFRQLCSLGADLVGLHLLEDDYEAASWNLPKDEGRGMKDENKNPLAHLITHFKGSGTAEVAKGYPKYNDCNVYVNPLRYVEGVPEEVWNFHIGGYQVCEKWLKDRRGRTLSDEDINHYQHVIVALNETIRLMAEIDGVIEEHGGWPLIGSQDAPKAEPANGLPFA